MKDVLTGSYQSMYSGVMLVASYTDPVLAASCIFTRQRPIRLIHSLSFSLSFSVNIHTELLSMVGSPIRLLI